MDNLLPLSKPDKYGARLISSELVSVQPIPSPIGKLNYMDYVYDSEYLRLQKIKERKEKIDQLIDKIKKGE